MAIQKGTSKRIEDSPGSRERERGRWRESWKNSAKNSPIHPFRSSSSISASFSAQRFLANSRLTFFLFAHFVFCFAFCFWLLVSYHLFLLFSADLEHFSYSLCVYYFASSYWSLRLRLSFRFSRFSISFLSLLFSVSLVQLSQCHKHRNPFFLPHQRCKRNKENQRLEYEP